MLTEKHVRSIISRTWTQFGAIWEAAIGKERRQIAHTLLETVYLDADKGPVVAIEPEAGFAPLFDILPDVKIGMTKQANEVGEGWYVPPFEDHYFGITD